MNRSERKRLVVLLSQFKFVLDSHRFDDISEFVLVYKKMYHAIVGQESLDLFSTGCTELPADKCVFVGDDLSYSDVLSRGELIYNRIHNKC